MIPKIIHYCWFGRGEKDKLTLKCIESWKKICPDYQIIEWNEDNCNLEVNDFVKEAYLKKKWAFVSDYFRLEKLVQYGGIYMDTDVEVLKSLDRLLDNECFFGYADDVYIASGMFGAVKENDLIKELLSYYETRHFIKSDESLDTTPNNKIYTAIFIKKYNFVIGDEYINSAKTRIYPSDYMSPFKIRIIGKDENIYCKDNFLITNNTIAIHYTVFSWGKRTRTSIQLLKMYVKQIIRMSLPISFYFALKRKVKLHEIKKIDI